MIALVLLWALDVQEYNRMVKAGVPDLFQAPNFGVWLRYELDYRREIEWERVVMEWFNNRHDLPPLSDAELRERKLPPYNEAPLSPRDRLRLRLPPFGTVGVPPGFPYPAIGGIPVVKGPAPVPPVKKDPR